MWANSSTASSRYQARSTPEGRSSYEVQKEQQRYQKSAYPDQAHIQNLLKSSHLSSSVPTTHHKVKDLYSGRSAPGAYLYHFTSSESPSASTFALNDSPKTYESPSFIPGSSPSQLSTSPFSTPRRAYRQRRKDPSCDACRERKVKCDATDTSSCSECTSRAVRCQFTKDTNRRMSSIKQMQDLDKQLNQVKEENYRLRRLLEENGIIGFDEYKDVISPRSPESTSNKFPKSSSSTNRVQTNFREIGSSIFNLPVPYRGVRHQPLITSTMPMLPPRDELQSAITCYYTHTHVIYPTFDWAAFTRAVDRVYDNETLEGVEGIWVAVFFAVLALGTLQSADSKDNANDKERAGIRYLELSIQHICILTEIITPSHAVSTLLVSKFLYEMNLRPAAWIWLSTSARIGYEISLHRDDLDLSEFDRGTAKQTWWSIFALDRIISFDLGKPFLISEDANDCPWPRDACYSSTQKTSDTELFSDHPISADRKAIHSIVQQISVVGRVMQHSFIPISALENFHDKFNQVKMLLPHAGQFGGVLGYDFTSLRVKFTLLFVQFLVYRSNLQCAPNSSEHTDALNRCLAIARYTCEYIARMLQLSSVSPEDWKPMNDWRSKLIKIADNAFCLHIWRSTLILCFAGHFQASLICVKTAAAIGNTRKVNAHCGRSLLLFLSRQLDKLNVGKYTVKKLESDEELLGYVCGDLQAVNENSWTWLNDKSATKSPQLPAEIMGEPMSDGIVQSPVVSSRPSSYADDDDDWNNWNSVEDLIMKLDQLSATAPLFGRSEVKELDHTPQSPRTTIQRSSERRRHDQASRISIANII